MKIISQSIGLEETEGLVYTALLALGPSTVTEITRKAGITRTLGYHTLEKLTLCGLVSRVADRATMRFAPEHPRRLLQFLKNKKNEQQRQLEAVEKYLPNLIALYKVVDKPVIHYQEGLNGLKHIYWQTLETKTEILSIVDLEELQKEDLKKFGETYARERCRRKIYERILMLDTPAGRNWVKHFTGSYRYTEHRWINPALLPGINEFGGELNIYENKLMIASMKQGSRMGIIIESAALANILKSMFALAWQVAEKIRVRSK